MGRKYSKNQGLRYSWVTVLVAFFLWFFLFTKGGFSATITDNFNDNQMNTSLWELYVSGGPSPDETNHRLEITIPSNASGGHFYGGYKTVLKFSGDLDVQVDYSLLTWPQPTNGVRVGIILYDVLGGYAAVERVSLENVGEVYVTHFDQHITKVGTGDLSGRLRLVRSGTNLSGYYWDGSNWVLISGGNYSGSNADTAIVIAAWSHDWCFADQYVKVAFDNFSASGPNVVPAPPAILLLGSGLLALGFTRRKGLKG